MSEFRNFNHRMVKTKIPLQEANLSNCHSLFLVSIAESNFATHS